MLLNGEGKRKPCLATGQATLDLRIGYPAEKHPYIAVILAVLPGDPIRLATHGLPRQAMHCPGHRSRLILRHRRIDLLAPGSDAAPHALSL